MDWLKNAWVKVTAALGVVIGLLLYFLSLKNKQANSLKAQVDLADTQKKADLIEADITKKLDQKDMLQKEVADHQQALVQLEDQRKKVAAKQDNLTPQQVTDYWNKK